MIKRLLLSVTMALVWMATITSALAVEVDVDGGITQYTKVANGNWYQDGFDHTLALTAPTAGLAVLTDKDFYGMQYGIGIGNYGEYKVVSQVLDFDANYNPNSPTHCNGPCQKLSNMKGWGNIPYFNVQARKSFDNGLILGAYITDTRASMHVTNYNWQASPPYGNTPTPIQFTLYHEVVNKWDFGAMVGYKFANNFTVEVEAIPTHAPNTQTSTGNPGEGPIGTSEYYRLLTKGYSARVLIEYTVVKF